MHSAAGWIIAVERRKGARPERYYVVFADLAAAESALRSKLGLSSEALLTVKDRMTTVDVGALKLRPGQVVKA